MSVNADAAEQVVRLSLQGTEVICRITGRAAEKIAMMIIAAMKQSNKTKGKARLVQMLKAGKPLKVIEVRKEDLKVFQEQAKRYGVLYCVLRERNGKKGGPERTSVDVFIREEDGPKINRIEEKFHFNTVKRDATVNEARQSLRESQEKNDSPFSRENPSGIDGLSENGSKRSQPNRRDPSYGDGQTDRPSLRPVLERKKQEYRNDLNDLGRAAKELNQLKGKENVK